MIRIGCQSVRCRSPLLDPRDFFILVWDPVEPITVALDEYCCLRSVTTVFEDEPAERGLSVADQCGEVLDGDRVDEP